MQFSDKQISALSAPLSSQHVKSRSQSGRELSYIEGWHAIAEANRIFGFDAWSRQTLELNCIAEKERAIGQAKVPGWGVSYSARVRITVGDIVREGCGTGHGIDRDLGQAHESALKEAETDAMKRALMTFGNPFGLALYDKTRANVSDTNATMKTSGLAPEDVSDGVVEYDEHGQPIDNIPIIDGVQKMLVSKPETRELAQQIQDEMHSFNSLPGLMSWRLKIAREHAKLPDKWQATMRRRFAEHRDFLRTQAEAAEAAE
jgi:DNA recombination protein Rad52